MPRAGEEGARVVVDEGQGLALVKAGAAGHTQRVIP